MAEKLTHEEHKARAMLMGRWYDWRDGTYNTQSDHAPDRFMNAITLEIETVEVVSRRLNQWGNDYALDPNRPLTTPYAR